jgi:acyl-CoA thioesterase YciA
MSDTAAQGPRGELSTRTMAMPKDTNPSGDIFGGWLMSEMDIAGSIVAWQRAQGRVATVAVRGMAFHAPVHVGDVLSCYTDIVDTGTTSITVNIEAWAHPRSQGRGVKVTEGKFVFVALDDGGAKRPLPANQK